MADEPNQALELPQEAKIYDPRCLVCKHQDREQIETDYMDFKASINDLAIRHGLNWTNVRGHLAHSGLTAKRNEDLLHPLRLIVDRGMTQGVKLTGEVVVRAVELQAKITGKLKPDNQVNIVAILNTLDDQAMEAIETEIEVETPDQSEERIG